VALSINAARQYVKAPATKTRKAPPTFKMPREVASLSLLPILENKMLPFF